MSNARSTGEKGHSTTYQQNPALLDLSAMRVPMVGSVGTVVAGWVQHPWERLLIVWDLESHNFGNCSVVSCGECTLAVLMQYIECSSVEAVASAEVGRTDDSESLGNLVLWVMLALAGAAFLLFTVSFLALLGIWLRRNSDRTQQRSANTTIGVAGTEPVTLGAVEPHQRRADRADREWKRCREVRYRSVERACNGFASDARIGEGSSGAVYRGTWRSTRDTRQAIVVKVLREGAVADDVCKKVEALRHCRHPNIVPLLAFCTEPPCIVMPFIGGGSLEALLDAAQQDARAGWPRWLQIACDALRALAYLHGSSAEKPAMVHRNVKPDNVLIQLSGEARLVDAHIVDEREKPGASLCGESGRSRAASRSLAFMDPEHRPNAGALTCASDMYSLGLVLFQLLCAAPSDRVAAPSPRELCCERWETPLRRLAAPELCEGWPAAPGRELHGLALECTSPSGAQRPLSGAALERLEAHEEKSAEPAEAGSPGSRPCVIDLCNARSGVLEPCHHWCVCEDCALILIMQRQPCPICRTPVQGFLSGADFDQTFVQ